MAIEHTDLLEKAKAAMGFSEAWISLGIVASSDIEELFSEFVSGSDPYPEHFRWRAFLRYLEKHSSLPPEDARELYMLGAGDPDRSMGGAMMARILRRCDCPEDLLRSALDSTQRHLRKIADKRLSELGKPKAAK